MAKLTEEEIQAIREANDAHYVSIPGARNCATHRLRVDTLRSMIQQEITGNYTHMLGPIQFAEDSLWGFIREAVVREQREAIRQEILRESLLDAIKSAVGSGEDSGSNVKPSAGFAAIAKLFSGLAERISGDVNKIQTALPASEEPTDAVGIAHAIINGFISGGLGSLGQMNKDLGLIGSAFAAAAKTVDSNPDETKKKLWSTINSNLGKATSGG